MPRRAVSRLDVYGPRPIATGTYFHAAPGIVDENVEPSELPQRRRRGVRLFCHIRDKRENAPRRACRYVRGALDLLNLARRSGHDVNAGARESERNRAPEPAAAPAAGVIAENLARMRRRSRPRLSRT